MAALQDLQVGHLESLVESPVEGICSITEDPSGNPYIVTSTGHILMVVERSCQQQYNTGGCPTAMVFDKDGAAYICDMGVKALLRHVEVEGRIEQTPFV